MTPTPNTYRGLTVALELESAAVPVQTVLVLRQDDSGVVTILVVLGAGGPPEVSSSDRVGGISTRYLGGTSTARLLIWY